MKILVSACLMGENCKYNGGNNLISNLQNEFPDCEFIPVCPEELGGLLTPRAKSEIRGNFVFNEIGVDVTENFLKGANISLEKAKTEGVRYALLKAKSPSCGKGEVYDGSFSGKVVPGNGKTAELLMKNGIEVFTEKEIEEFKTRLKLKETTLCYIEKGDKVLLLYRNKKANDYNGGKWIGVGGKFEEGETPEECLVREVWEETGLKLENYQKRGLVFFEQNGYSEVMHLFTANEFSGSLKECSEGELCWVNKSEIMEKPTWEGDREFLKLIYEENCNEFFILKLYYDGDNLVKKERIGK